MTVSGRARRDKGARYESVMSQDFSVRSDWLGAHDPRWSRSLQAQPWWLVTSILGAAV